MKKGKHFFVLYDAISTERIKVKIIFHQENRIIRFKRFLESHAKLIYLKGLYE